MNVSVAGISHSGSLREKNQDNLYINNRWLRKDHGNVEFSQVYTISQSIPAVFGVFDGMGGEQYGEMASYIAAKSMSAWQRRLIQSIEKNYSVELRGYTEYANSLICEKTVELKADTIGTTASVTCINDSEVWICNIGDSPILLWRNGDIMPIFQEHTDRDFLQKNGIQRKPRITQFLGIDPAEMTLEPYVQKFAINRGDIYILCSDGLTNEVPVDRIGQVLCTNTILQQKAIMLREEALGNGGKDNISIILIEV